MKKILVLICFVLALVVGLKSQSIESSWNVYRDTGEPFGVLFLHEYNNDAELYEYQYVPDSIFYPGWWEKINCQGTACLVSCYFEDRTLQFPIWPLLMGKNTITGWASLYNEQFEVKLYKVQNESISEIKEPHQLK